MRLYTENETAQRTVDAVLGIIAAAAAMPFLTWVAHAWGWTF